MKTQSNFQITKQRINDSNIMENELNKNDKLTKELKQFNTCRMFLQVNYLSEITTIDGRPLDPSIISTTTTNRTASNLLWPNQQQPKSKYWTKWIRKIKQRYCVPNSLRIKEQFILGQWIQPHHKLTHIYKWTFSPRLLEAYSESKTYSCKEINHLTFTISSATKNQEYHPPSDAHPIYVIQNQFTIQVNSQLIKNNPPNPSTFIDYCKNLQQWKKQLLQHIFTEYPDSLATRIQEGTPLIIATDSTKSRKQSGGRWIITTIDGKSSTWSKSGFR